MNDFNTQFHTHAQEARLTEGERRRILAALRSAAPVRAVPSPFFFAPSARNFGFAFAALALVIGAGGAAAYASESALPGDALYPVKVAVTEPVLGAFAASPEAKAAWNANVAATRLDEATALAARGELTATTSAELALNFNTHADALAKSDARFTTLAAKAGDVLAAGKASGDASTTVESGRLVLAISLSGTATDTAADAAPVMATMSAPAEAPAEEAEPRALMAPMMMKAAFAPTAPEDDAALLETLSVEAHSALDEATTTAAAAAPLSDDAEARLSDLSSLVVRAEAERIVGSTTEAVADFKDALSRVADLMLILNDDAPEDAAPADASSSSDTIHTPYPI